MAYRPRLVPVTAASFAMLVAGCSGSLQDGAPSALFGQAQPSEISTASVGGRSELEKATSYWAKEFANNPRNIEAAVNYAKNLKAMGEKDRALAVLQQASIYNSDHKGLASEYGRLALENDQAQLAEKLLARAEDPLKPDWKIISAHGAAIAKQGRHRDAIPLLERALALSPDNPAILNNLGMAQAMNGEAPKAETTLRKAMALPNAAPRVRHNLALVLGLQRKFEEAKEITGAELPPDKSAANIAYLRNMVDEQPAAPTGAAREHTATPVKSATASKLAPAKLKGGQSGNETKEVASSGWSTEVASAGESPGPTKSANR